MLSYDFIQCAVVILIIFIIGEIVSTQTKAFVPSVFVAAVLFLLGFWSPAIPTEIIEVSGLSALGISAMLCIVVHMGTMLSPRELLENWKTVVISLASLCGLVGFLMIIGSNLLDWNTVIVSIPPLAGGMTAAIIMQGRRYGTRFGNTGGVSDCNLCGTGVCRLSLNRSYAEA